MDEEFGLFRNLVEEDEWPVKHNFNIQLFYFQQGEPMLGRNLLYAEMNHAIYVDYQGFYYPLIQKIGVAFAFYYDCQPQKKTLICWIDEGSKLFGHYFANETDLDGDDLAQFMKNILTQDAFVHMEALRKKSLVALVDLLNDAINPKPCEFESLKNDTCYETTRRLVWDTVYPDFVLREGDCARKEFYEFLRGEQK